MEMTKSELLEAFKGAEFSFDSAYKGSLLYSASFEGREILVDAKPWYRQQLLPVEPLKDLLDCEMVDVFVGGSRVYGDS